MNAKLLVAGICLSALWMTGWPSLSAQSGHFKVAFYNIRAGQGIQALRGHAEPFAITTNCDPGKGPVNAWGAGVVQKELTEKIKNDPSVVALGVAEAWLCASPEQVRGVLGWKEHSGERNGVALLARFGFGGRPEWVQLDTSKNKNPKDTMWVVGAPVCLDARCTSKVDVYTAHWYGTGPDGVATENRQAQQTVAFMDRSKGPHVLVGDLNAFEGTGEVCHQQPNNSSLSVLREAGYVDAWPAVHGNEEGFTGMVNRAGCGKPEGYPWKRIDYAWSFKLPPVSMTRFGMVPPGDAAPSDHYGIVVEF
jgi:hypothetical protein